MSTVDTSPVSPTLLLSLHSGASLAISHIFLHDQSLLQRAAELRAKAEEGLRGVSTGLGFIGSPQWVIGGALILGAIEALASNAAAKKALSELVEESEVRLKAQESGMWFQVSDIHQVVEPEPSRWSAVLSGSAAGHRIYAHPQADFVAVRTLEGTEFRIRIASVDSYRVFPIPRHVPRPQLQSVADGQVLPGLSSSIPATNRARAEQIVSAVKRDPRLPIDEKIELLTLAGGAFQWTRGSACVAVLGEARMNFDNGKEFGNWVERQLIPMLEGARSA